LQNQQEHTVNRRIVIKLPSYRRIFKTDYAEDYQPLVEKLAVSINYGFDTLYDALNKKLTFADNIASTIAQFTVTVDEDGVPLKKTQFKLNDAQSNVEGLIVLDCYGEKDSKLLPTGGIFINFIKNENYIIINNIKGLQSGKSYIIKILSIG